MIGSTTASLFGWEVMSLISAQKWLSVHVGPRGVSGETRRDRPIASNPINQPHFDGLHHTFMDFI